MEQKTETITEKVVRQVLTPSKKEFKYPEPTRKYWREHCHKYRLKKKRCTCGAQAKYTEIATKKQLCLKCLVKQEKEKQTPPS